MRYYIPTTLLVSSVLASNDDFAEYRAELAERRASEARLADILGGIQRKYVSSLSKMKTDLTSVVNTALTLDEFTRAHGITATEIDALVAKWEAEVSTVAGLTRDLKRVYAPWGEATEYANLGYVYDTLHGSYTRLVNIRNQLAEGRSAHAEFDADLAEARQWHSAQIREFNPNLRSRGMNYDIRQGTYKRLVAVNEELEALLPEKIQKRVFAETSSAIKQKIADLKLAFDEGLAKPDTLTENMNKATAVSELEGIVGTRADELLREAGIVMNKEELKRTLGFPFIRYTTLAELYGLLKESHDLAKDPKDGLQKAIEWHEQTKTSVSAGKFMPTERKLTIRALESNLQTLNKMRLESESGLRTSDITSHGLI